MIHPLVRVLRQPGGKGSLPDSGHHTPLQGGFMGIAHLFYVLLPAVVVVILGALLVCPMNPWCCLRCK